MDRFTKWQYKQEYNCESMQLDRLGKDGWELIAIDSHGYIHTFYFKRPLSQPKQ